jgi:DNA-directed RNA polymerase specialized sigma24 family protein
MDRDEFGAPYWPARVRTLVSEFRTGAGPAERERARAELWTLVNLVLQRYVGAIARRSGGVGPDEVPDIASEKALDFIRRLDQPEWNLEPYSTAQIVSFFTRMSHNGVIDSLRKKGRELPLLTNDDGTLAVEREPTSTADAESGVLGPEYARAILECFSNLTPRARLAWFLRVFYELSSRDIARHPGVRTTPAAVDMMLLRSREHVRTCMEARGLDAAKMPTGTFGALWNVFGGDAEAAP